METDIPNWMTKEFIKQSLENGKEYNVIFEDFKIDMPIAKGTNYTTKIYRVTVVYRKSSKMDKLHRKVLIIKVPIKGDNCDEWMEGTGFIEREPEIYKELLPKLKAIFGKVDDEDEEDLFAESYFSAVKDVVILDDLKEKGFKMADRLKKLDFDHTIVALKALAKFHAGSAVLYEKDPVLVEKIGKEICYRNELKEIYSSLVESNFKILAKEFKTRPKFVEYGEWLEENVDSVWENTVKAVEKNDNEISVLNHGDFWTANMLFRYNDDGKPSRTKIIDLQLCRYTSPVIDFMYFIDTSVQDKVRTDNLEEFIRFYVDQLNVSLAHYGSSKRLDESDFKKAFNERSYYRVYANVALLPIVLSDTNETLLDISDTSLDVLKDSSANPLVRQIASNRFMSVISQRFKEFENDGLVKRN